MRMLTSAGNFAAAIFSATGPRITFDMISRDHDYDALDNECRNRPFEKRVFGNSPELEMPAIDQRPEDDGRGHSGKRKGGTKTYGQTPLPEDVS